MIEENLRNGTLSRRSFLQLLGATAGLAAMDAVMPEELESQQRKKERASLITDSLSPFNAQRKVRSRTDGIVLHTTEAGDESSRNSIHRFGTANYLVLTSGEVIRTIESKRIAKHAGRSMWNGKTDLSSWTVGIEVSGYHDRDITGKQITALRQLIADEQGRYGVADAQVWSHSMIAYGSPNKYQKANHRGRKRCGMQFGTEQVRYALGLTSDAKYDPDVRSGRLIVADKELERVLYGGASATVASGPKATASNTAPSYVAPKQTPKAVAQSPKPSQPQINPLPRSGDIAATVDDEVETVRLLGMDGPTPYSIVGMEYNSANTIYFMPDGRVFTGRDLDKRRGKFPTLPNGTGILPGYVYGGVVQPGHSAFSVVKSDWNQPSTFYYTAKGGLVSGDGIKETEIPRGAVILFQR